MPGCISPENLTKTDSGISIGITPIAAANATRPDPAGKDIPIGNRECESHQYHRIGRVSFLFNHGCITPISSF